MLRSARSAVIVTVAVALFALPATALAHQRRTVGNQTTVVGWLEEPAFAGFQNAVQFRVADADDEPVEDAQLQVEVLFGDETSDVKTEALPLEPAFGSPGEYHADIIPTEAGTYTFHIVGTIAGAEFDELYTSGEAGVDERSTGTYNDVREPTEVQFPAKYGSTAQLDQKLAAGTERAMVVAEGADDAAGTATLLAIIALAVAVVGSGAALLTRPRKARA